VGGPSPVSIAARNTISNTIKDLAWTITWDGMTASIPSYRVARKCRWRKRKPCYKKGNLMMLEERALSEEKKLFIY
jgi:hypothetical protein